MHPSHLVILGDPVSQSRSPSFQSAAIAAAGLQVRYEALRVAAANLRAFATRLAGENAGGNVTVPHKCAFVELCSDVTSLAKRVGAVNTFWTENGALKGDNTDVAGFDAAAREILRSSPEGITVAIVGAGGAAAAALGAIEQWSGAKARIFSRRASQASELARRFQAFTSVETSAANALRGAKLIVNATPLGMKNDELPFDLSVAPDDAAILDLVYKPGGTELVRKARTAGIPAADGTTMLIEQGARSFEIWFGFAPDRGVMRAALG